MMGWKLELSACMSHGEGEHLRSRERCCEQMEDVKWTVNWFFSMVLTGA
jgi:hypothetical protein